MQDTEKGKCSREKRWGVPGTAVAGVDARTARIATTKVCISTLERFPRTLDRERMSVRQTAPPFFKVQTPMWQMPHGSCMTEDRAADCNNCVTGKWGKVLDFFFFKVFKRNFWGDITGTSDIFCIDSTKQQRGRPTRRMKRKEACFWRSYSISPLKISAPNRWKKN
jgi:hypothetical protein